MLREEQICLNHANELPGVRFTKREDWFAFFPPFFSLCPFYPSFPLLLFTSHRPPRTLGAELHRKSLDFLPSPVQRRAVLEARAGGEGVGGCQALAPPALVQGFAESRAR